MMGGNHLSVDDLAALLVDGPASPGSTLATSHLAGGCPRCTQAMAWVRHTVEAARADRLQAPPERVLRRACSIYPIAPHSTRGQVVRHIVGRLIYDSLTGARSGAARSGGTAGRQSLYDVPELGVEIDMLVQDDRTEGPGRSLTGQVLAVVGEPPLLDYVAVRSAGGEETPGRLLTSTEFSAHYAGDCAHTLAVRIGADEIVLPLLEP